MRTAEFQSHGEGYVRYVLSDVFVIHTQVAPTADVVKMSVVLRNRGGVSCGRDGMQKVRSPCGSADLRETPAVPEFAQWRSAFTRCLASASSLS